MKSPIPRYLSIAAASGFALWVLWLWVDPLEEKRVEKVLPKKMPEMTQTVKPQADPKQVRIFVLPEPPTPAVQPQPVKPQPVKQKPPLKAVKIDKPVEGGKGTLKPVVKKVVAKLTPQPIVKPAPKPVKMVHEASPAEAVNGRALLRVLEHGKGPQIEIAWPREARVRDELYEKFQSCFGMENALMDGAGNLYRLSDAQGQRWEINLDRFSGFLRQASGRLPQLEERKMNQITRHHGGLVQPVPVRIFPRRVDASLLGGLKAVIGEAYMNAKFIQARYDEQGLIGDIRIDGKPVSGTVRLSQFKRCAWRV